MALKTVVFPEPAKPTSPIFTMLPRARDVSRQSAAA